MTESKVNRIHELVFKYQKLKKKIGKTAVLDKLKMHIRRLPSEEEQVFRAAELVFELKNTGDIPYIEVLRKVICLTGIPESRADALLPDALEKLGIDFEEMSEEEVNTAITINKEDVMDVYCDLLLKRRFKKRMMEK
ncbi:MAG: hypothetical protein SCH70_00020 [Candidatus Methanoperedens sp.]|nr:hypothetical protein [Candidatus Methanoperedens sp.]